MRVSKLLLLSLIYLLGFAGYAESTQTWQIGLGYGREFREKKDLAQYELFTRYYLPSYRALGSGWQAGMALELGGALISDTGFSGKNGGRVCLMPQIFFTANGQVIFFAGLGVGGMLGDTDYDGQDLGGSVLFNSKLGVQFLKRQHWGLGFSYYHQSNGGIYNHNAGLNMIQVGLVYSF